MAVKSAILGFFVAILAGNRPYKGCGNRYGWNLAKNVINNPLTYLAGAVAGATGNLNLGSADIGIKGGLDGFAYEGALFFEAEILEHHGGAQYLRNGVSNVQTLALRPGAVNGLEYGGMIAG